MPCRSTSRRLATLAVLLCCISGCTGGCTGGKEDVASKDAGWEYERGSWRVELGESAGVDDSWPAAVPKPTKAHAGELTGSYMHKTPTRHSWLLSYTFKHPPGCSQFAGTLVQAGFRETARFDSDGSITGVFENGPITVVFGCNTLTGFTLGVTDDGGR